MVQECLVRLRWTAERFDATRGSVGDYLLGLQSAPASASSAGVSGPLAGVRIPISARCRPRSPGRPSRSRSSRSQRPGLPGRVALLVRWQRCGLMRRSWPECVTPGPPAGPKYQEQVRWRVCVFEGGCREGEDYGTPGASPGVTWARSPCRVLRSSSGMPIGP